MRWFFIITIDCWREISRHFFSYSEAKGKSKESLSRLFPHSTVFAYKLLYFIVYARHDFFFEGSKWKTFGISLTQILVSKSPIAPFGTFIYTIQAEGIVLERQNSSREGELEIIKLSDTR